MSGNSMEFNIHFQKGRNGLQQLRIGKAPDSLDVPKGSIPRISRLMALAIKMEGMLERGEVKNYAELALLGHVSRARITQIMSLLRLAPDIQEDILNLSCAFKGRDPIRHRHLRMVFQEERWDKQRIIWDKMSKSSN